MPKERHSVWSKYPYDAHGHDGVALIRNFLVQHNFWPRAVMLVAGFLPVALARSHTGRNLWLWQQCIPRTMQQVFIPIRGVQFWVYDGPCQARYKWKSLTAPPPPTTTTTWNTCFGQPASSVRPLGESQVAWYQQCKGHFFWKLYDSENDGNLEVKWLKGRLPPGGVRWASW